MQQFGFTLSFSFQMLVLQIKQLLLQFKFWHTDTLAIYYYTILLVTLARDSCLIACSTELEY